MVEDNNNSDDDVSFSEFQETGDGDVAVDENDHDGHSGNGSGAAGGGGAGANAGGGAGIPDIMLLNMYCARAKAPRDPKSSDDRMEAELSWEPVRDWLSSHDADEVRMAAEQQGESGLTALHFACRHVPPLDVIDVLLSVAAETTVQWPDNFGWLPIHYACASGSSSEVIKALVEAFPESKTTVDRRGRTPLHFALGDKPASPDVVFLLGSSGAASYPDEIGMLVRIISYNVYHVYLR
jgi:Ankyrin repeats (3 copies)